VAGAFSAPPIHLKRDTPDSLAWYSQNNPSPVIQDSPRFQQPSNRLSFPFLSKVLTIDRSPRVADEDPHASVT